MADNKTQVIISAKDDTAAAFASVQAGMNKLSSALNALGVGLSGTALLASVKSIIDLGDSMNDLSQRVGINIKDLAAWQLAANQSGTSIESVAKGVKGLSQYMTSNGDALKKAGIDATDANGALIQLADLFESLPDGVQKTALAVKLFGKAGMDMIPMLNLGSAGLLEAADKARAYGEKMALLAPLADKFNDQMAELSLQTKETGMSIATYFLPGLIGLSTFLNDIKSGGDRAKTALEWLADSNSEIISGAAKLAMLLGVKRVQGYSGPMDAQGLPKSASGTSAEDMAAFDAATERYLKERDAAKKAKDMLGKESADRELSYLAGLRQALAAASGDISEYSKQLLFLTQGAGKEFSAQTKAQALSLAKQTDTLRENTKALELRQRVLEKVAAAENAANKTVADFGFKQEQRVGDVQARTSALGMTPQEVKQAEAARAIQKEYEDAVKKVNEELGKIGDVEGISEKTRALTVERDKAFIAAAAAIDAEKAKQDALNASWEYGADTALRKYGEELANVAATVEGAMTRAFKGMEDALVSFVKTGKLNFKSLADSIVTDIIRIQIQQSIMKPLTKSMEGGNFLGGLKGLFGFADGGIMSGSGPLPLRSYAGGGVASSPQLAVFGEGAMNEAFVPLPDGRSIPVSLRGGGHSVVIHQTVNIDSRSDQATIMQAMVQAKNAAVAQIHDSMRRGGAFA